jgi:hypothetical protein
MDFIVSKVALSVLALMTAGTLYGLYDGDMLTDVEGDLERILQRFADETARPSAERVESRAVWEVPGLPDGDVVWLVVGGPTVEAHSGSSGAALLLSTDMHTWSPTDDPLNGTALESLDSCSARLRACTGQHVTVESEVVMVDNMQELMLFVEVGP